jgi:hypothetical protein
VRLPRFLAMTCQQSMSDCPYELMMLSVLEWLNRGRIWLLDDCVVAESRAVLSSHVDICFSDLTRSPFWIRVALDKEW